MLWAERRFGLEGRSTLNCQRSKGCTLFAIEMAEC
jgi:hypothetical protein